MCTVPNIYHTQNHLYDRKKKLECLNLQPSPPDKSQQSRVNTSYDTFNSYKNTLALNLAIQL